MVPGKKVTRGSPHQHCADDQSTAPFVSRTEGEGSEGHRSEVERRST